MSARQSAESDALAGEVWQEADNVLLLCVEPGKTWQDFNGQRFPWDAPTVARPLRRLLDRAGNLAPEYVTPPAETECSRGPCWKGAGHEGPCQPGWRDDPRRVTPSGVTS